MESALSGNGWDYGIRFQPAQFPTYFPCNEIYIHFSGRHAYEFRFQPTFILNRDRLNENVARLNELCTRDCNVWMMELSLTVIGNS